MPTSAPLLIDLAGIARLADVRRPVASMWRTRFASSADPFPAAVAEQEGRALFDVVTVAAWLDRGSLGNNPDIVGDAAAWGMPDGFDIADEAHVAAVDALLTVRAAGTTASDGIDGDALQRAATRLDPRDECLVSELAAMNPRWADWAERLADAAYSPLAASRMLERRHARALSSKGSAGSLTPAGRGFVASLAAALAADHVARLDLLGSIRPQLAEEIVSGIPHEIDVAPSASHEGRATRRRLMLEGVASLVARADLETAAPSRLIVMRAPSAAVRTQTAMLAAVDELVLGMSDADRAIVVAPAAVLTDALSGADQLRRADALRSGRLRAVLRLPAGLVRSAPREALAVWVLGREVGDVPLAERYTAVADLKDAALTEATRTDLVSDVLAAMGSAFDVRAHAFRFTRLARTTSMVASAGTLISEQSRPVRTPSPRDLPALLDRAVAALGEDAPAFEPVPATLGATPPASITALLAEKAVRIIPGTRLDPEDAGRSGLVVVTGADLDRADAIGRRHVDPLLFAARHPSAHLTAPGDVIFRTGPSPRAWVDHEGSKVVAYPARVLRVTRPESSGLVPELVVADIERAPAGPGAWRRWRLHRVAPSAVAPLRAALADLASSRRALEQRIAALDTYTDLLGAAVAAGAVTFPASDSH